MTTQILQSRTIPGQRQRRSSRPDSLTPRERQILALLSNRLTDAEIAARLYISPRTASNHVCRILAKLGAANRREAGALGAQIE